MNGDKKGPIAIGDKAGSPFVRPEGPNGEVGGPRSTRLLEMDEKDGG